MRREKQADGNQESGNAVDDDIAARFEDIEKDERLQAARITLPDAPKREWKPPVSETAGTKPTPPGAVAEFRGAGIGYSIGLTLVTSILIGAALGWAVDKFLLHSNGTPWGLIIGFLAGVVNGFYQMIVITNRLNADEDAARNGRGAGR